MSHHVVALSGGKDSTAMSLRLHELHPEIDYSYVFTPTGDELPDMIGHWQLLGERLGKPLVPLTGRSLKGEIRRQQHLPNFRSRWCTRMLKIEPYEEHLIRLSKTGEVFSYVGLRADEPERQGGMYDHIPGVQMLFPMREWGWGLRNVREYLMAQEIQVPQRTDCASCYHQGIGEWWSLWRFYPDLFEEMAALEEEVSASRERPHTLRSPERDSWPAGLRELGVKFAAGHRPAGAGQLDLIGDIKDSRCRVCSL